METRSFCYDKFSQFLHWVTAALVLLTFSLGPENFGRLVEAGADPNQQLSVVIHETMGIIILGLTVVRLGWMLVRKQRPTHHMARALRVASRVIHGVLMLLLVAIPMTALLNLFNDGVAASFLGLGTFSPTWLTFVLPKGLLTAADYGSIHGFLGVTLLWLAGLHALAAIYHHLRIKDRVLVSMIPRGRLP